MLSTRDIKHKIRAVQNIQKICKAMKTVSSIKLRKAEERIKNARGYAEAMREMTLQLSGADYPHPLLEVRPLVHYGLVAISSDKGLAGSYNTNLIREASRLVREHPATRTVTLGRKVSDSFRRQGFDIETALSPLGAVPEFRSIAALADRIGALYTDKQLDQVDLVYTQYGGRVVVQQLLPILRPADEEPVGDFIFEPDAGAILTQLLPRYLRTQLFTAVLSAIAAEHAARVAAMTLASENAEELISTLTMDYNKSRQAAITNELIDIVGAAEAIR